MAAPVSRGSSFSREEIRRRSSNSTNSDGYTAALPTQAYRREKPKFDPKHPWHRINTTTRGVTKRSGKINQYEAEKMYKQGLKNPFGTWRSPNYKFEYYEHGELAKLEYTAEEIKDFIYHHPVNSDSKLRMWIQKTPADSGRRYATPTLAKCRFSGCPSRTAGLNGTIWSGHMRVALDERSFKYQEKADPFYMAGYFHLYCVEKFLDLPEICTLPNVEVLADMRQLANEPNMKWSASLSAVKEGIVAQRFIQSCRKGRSRIRDFEAYPRPHTTLPGADKPHELMLNYRMQKVKEGDRARSSKVSLNKRPQRETQVNVNLGDLEVACRAKIAMRKPQPALQSRAKRRQRRSSSWISEVDSDYVSEDEPPERIRKKRRVEEHGPGAVAAEQRHQQAMAPATPAVQLARQQSINNTAYLALGAGYPDAPAPTFAPAANAPASTQISTPSIAPDDLAALLDFATAPSEQPLPLLPDYPPIANGSPADHTTVVRRDLAIPDSYSLTADFTLAKPTKRAAADAEFAAQSPFKRERLSTAAELHSIPLSDISANVPPAAPVRRTDAGGVVDEECWAEGEWLEQWEWGWWWAWLVGVVGVVVWVLRGRFVALGVVGLGCFPIVTSLLATEFGAWP
ncbi:hypothetical protein GTA08_BOTSDO08184 [Neofusicoccum parvum]|nr:hypothetical protein GTA08_BOTSDO08184 [Neofusicoccum parvum]